jgi:hypothetical protein
MVPEFRRPPEIRAELSLFPYAVRCAAAFLAAQKRFVHYSSADSATKILQSETVWLRNARFMNDFSEMEYGANYIQAALNSEAGKKLKRSLLNASPKTASILNEFFNILPSIKSNTFILCLSEHERAEDATGRLSMWRAYSGDDDGVAIVLNNLPFFQTNSQIFPVGYLTEQQFLSEFSAVVSNLPAIISGCDNFWLFGRSAER